MMAPLAPLLELTPLVVLRGLARVEACLREPSARTDIERASAWDFLGARYVDLGRIEDSAEAFARAAGISPSPRILREWGTLESMRGARSAATLTAIALGPQVAQAPRRPGQRTDEVGDRTGPARGS